MGVNIVTFLQDNLDYIFFLDGFFFIFAGVISLLLHLRKSSKIPWIWLSLFGFTQGLNPWISLLGINFSQQQAVEYAAFSVMVLSLIVLLEFVRRVILNSYISKNFKIIAVSISMYAIANMFVIFKSQALITQATNADLIFLYFQAVSTFLGIIIFVSLWLYYIRYEENSEKLPSLTLRNAILPLWALGIILSLGWFFVDILGEHRKELLSKELLTRATVAAKSLDGEKIKNLTATESDIGKSDYEELKKFLMKIKVASRFLYLMTLREGRVFFLLDSEPVDSPDYSPAGQKYSEIEQNFVEKLQQNKPAIYGPYTDRWGTWTTAIIPLNLSLKGKSPVYFCGDVDAVLWLQEIHHDRLSGIMIVLLFCLLAFYFYLMTTKILQVNTKLKEEVGLFVGGPSFVMKWKFSDGHLKILYISPNMTLHLGYDTDVLLLHRISFLGLIHPDDRAAFDHALDVIGKKIDSRIDLEFRLLHADGSYRWFQAFMLSKNHTYTLSYHGYFTDITDRKDAESDLKIITDRLVLHFQQLPFAVIEWDTNFRAVDWNPAAERIFGFTKEEAMGKSAEELILPAQVISHISGIWSELLNGKGGKHSINENQTKEGKIILCEWYNSPLIDENGKLIGIASIAEDVTEKKQFEQKLEYLAYYDALTGLPNRTLFKDRLKIESHRADRNHTIIGVVFINIDFFKTVNDTLGHGVGDILLQAVASRLKVIFRATDTVSRFGADEFAVILPDLKHVDDVEHILHNVFDQFAVPFDVLEHKLNVTMSIGYSFYPIDETNPEMLLRNANVAMYDAKESGRNKYRRYQHEMTDHIQSQLIVQNGLINAIKNGEFVLYYQPQLNIASNMVTGVEALIRWQHPEKGILAPAEFIHIAEKTGLIVPIGEWVLRTACQQLQSWRKQGLYPLTMAVNLSSRQLQEENFPKKVIEIFHETGVDPKAIELELTESILLENTAKVLTILTDFKALGVNLSLDDFGTGYSSLSYLKLFPITKLKIDQSFVQNVTANGSDSNLVRAIIAMGKALHLTTIAEGVERQEQFDFLREEGCDEIQGYWLSKPMPASQFEIFLNARD